MGEGANSRVLERAVGKVSVAHESSETSGARNCLRGAYSSQVRLSVLCCFPALSLPVLGKGKKSESRRAGQAAEPNRA